MAVKPNLPPSAQPWGRQVDEQLRNTKRVRGASVQAVNGILQANGATEQRVSQAAQAAQAATNLAEVARLTADGKGTRYDIVSGASRPTGATSSDILYEWTGPSAFEGVVEFVGAWSETANDWVAQELSHQTIASLDLGKATVGYLNGGRIEAASLDSLQLLQAGSALGNLLSDPSFIRNFTFWVRSDSSVTSPSAVPSGKWVESTPVRVFSASPYDDVALVASAVTSDDAGGVLSIMTATSASGPWTTQASASTFASSDVPHATTVKASFSPISGVPLWVKLRFTGGSAHYVVNQFSDPRLTLNPNVGLLAGILPVVNGGTGVTTAAAERNRLGLGNTTGAVPIANGGTGGTSVATARSSLGMSVQEAYFTTTVTVTSSASGMGGTVTLPAGMTQSNTLISLTKQGGGLAKYIPHVNWTSSTTFQMGLYSGDGTSATGNVVVFAHAIRIS